MKIHLVAATLLGAALLPLAAQAKESQAQQSQAQSAITVTAEFQRDWERGSRLEAEGLEELARAQRELVRRSAEVVNLRNRRDTAAERAENARRTFERLTANTVFADPREARRWAQELERAARDWEENTKRRDEADRDLERALRRQTDAQAAVAEAQAKIDEGRAMMAMAERASAAGARR